MLFRYCCTHPLAGCEEAKIAEWPMIANEKLQQGTTLLSDFKMCGVCTQLLPATSDNAFNYSSPIFRNAYEYQ